MASKYIISFVLTLFLVNSLKSQEEKQDAIYLSMTKEFQLNDDGSTEYHYSKQVRLLTHNAFQRQFGETFILFDPSCQQLKINEAHTVMAAGKKVAGPENAFNEVLPRFAADAPAYNHLREMVVTHTGLEVNATIFLDYTISSSKEYMPELMGNEVLTAGSPIRELNFIIRIPKDRQLSYKVLEIRAAPEIYEENGMQVYKWKFLNLPANSQEHFQPENHDHLPRIIFSTAKNLYQAIDFITRQETFRFGINEDMSQAVKKVVSSSFDDMEKLLQLQDIVVNQLNLYGVPAEEAGYKSRTAIETWQSNGGTELEKTVLLTALCLKAGYEATTVAVIPLAFYDKVLGSLSVVKKFDVLVKNKEAGLICLSATHLHPQNLYWGLSGYALAVMDPNMESLYTYFPEQVRNSIRMEGQFVLDPGYSLKGELSYEISGVPNPYLDLKRDQNISMNMLNPAFYPSEITNKEIKNIRESSSLFSFKVFQTDRVKTQENFAFWPVPSANAGLDSWNMKYLPENRDSPLELPYSLEEQYHYTLKLPENAIWVTGRTDIHEKNKVGEVNIVLIPKENEMEITRTIILSEQTIGVSHYNDLQLLINTWYDKRFTQIIFKK